MTTYNDQKICSIILSALPEALEVRLPDLTADDLVQLVLDEADQGYLDHDQLEDVALRATYISKALVESQLIHKMLHTLAAEMKDSFVELMEKE